MTPAVLNVLLMTYIKKGNAEGLRDYLATLRTTDFRLAGRLLSNPALWAEADFWHYAAVLVQADNRAYLGTMLKAAVGQSGTFPTAEFAKACTTDIDRKKVLEAYLPLMKKPQAAQDLMTLFSPEGTATDWWLGLFFRIGTPVSYFLLFNLLKRYEDRPEFLRRYGVELIRKGDKASFNLACIIQEYFGLPELPGTFSLVLPAYELSRLDTCYEAFQTILKR